MATPEGSPTSMKVSKDVQILFEQADIERSKLGDSYISTASVFLGFFSQNLQIPKKILEDENLSYQLCLEGISKIRGNTKNYQKRW